MTNSNNFNYLKTIIDEGIRQTRLAQLSGLRHLEKVIDEGIRQTRLAQLPGSLHLEKVIFENPISNQIKLAHEIESLRHLELMQFAALRHLEKAFPENPISNQIKLAHEIESLRRLGIGIPAKSILTQISPTASVCKKTFDELHIKKHIKYRLSLVKCAHLIPTVDEIDFSEIVIFYSDLPSGARLEEKLLPFLEDKRLEIDESIKGLSQAQKLILVAIFKRDQNQKESSFVEWNSITSNASKDSKSRSKARLIRRGLIAPNPAKPTKEGKLTRLGRYAARRILTETVNFSRSTIGH